MPTVEYENASYKLKSRKTKIPNFEDMSRTSVLIWLNQNTKARGYIKAQNPLTGMPNAINVTSK
jgi:hypothetical protein